MISHAQRLVSQAIGDSYYPDLGQSVNAERMINVLAPALDAVLAALVELDRPHIRSFMSGKQENLLDAAIKAVGGKP